MKFIGTGFGVRARRRTTTGMIRRRVIVALVSATALVASIIGGMATPAGAAAPIGMDVEATVSGPATAPFGQTLSLTAGLNNGGTIPYTGTATLQVDVTGGTIGTPPAGCTKPVASRVRCAMGVPGTTTIPVTPAAIGTPVVATASEQANNDLAISLGGDTDECEPPASGGAASGPNCVTSTTAITLPVSTTTLASSANPSVYGDSVTYTAAIRPSSATGTVSFSDGGSAVANCGAQVVAAGQATCTTTPASAGSHAIVATYGGDSSYLGSSAGLTQVVNKAPTSTIVSSSLNPSIYRDTVTYTATISATGTAGPTPPAGTASFSDGGVLIVGCSAQAVTAGQATCTTTPANAGSHGIAANYSGDANHLGSSGGLTQIVNKASTVTTLSSSANPITYGQSVTYTATVTPGAATGTVTFTDGAGDGATTIANCGAVPLTDGVATCTTTPASAGSHAISAAYSGDNNYAAGGASMTETVNKAPTTTVVAASANPITYGQSVTYTATISPAPATGTVSFTDGDGASATTIAGCANRPVSTGTASCTTSPNAGIHSIAANYSGDSNYLSSSAAMSETVNKAATTTALTTSANPQTVNKPVTYTARLSPSAASGTVSFADGANPVSGCASRPVSAGVATCDITYTNPGDHNIVATYSGDGNYLASTSGSIAESIFAEAIPAGSSSTPFVGPVVKSGLAVPLGAPLVYSTLGEITIDTYCGVIKCSPRAAESLFTSNGQTIYPNNPLVLTITYDIAQRCRNFAYPAGCRPIYWIGSGESIATQVQRCPTYSTSRVETGGKDDDPRSPSPNKPRMLVADIPCLNFVSLVERTTDEDTYTVTYQVALTKDITLPLLGATSVGGG